MVVKFSAFLSLLTISFPNTFPFSSVQLLSHAQLFATPWTTALQASLSITNSRSPPKPVFIVSVMPSNHIILCRPLLLLPSIFPSIRVFSNESALCIRWPKYWSFSFNISPSNEYPGLISFRLDWLDLLAVQGTLKSLSQHHSSKAHPFYSLTKIFWHNISLPGSSVHGILQARILEWVSILFSRGIFLTQGLNSSPALQADSLPFETLGKPQDIWKKGQNWVKSMK